MRPYFIVNPIAGGGAAGEKFETVKKYLSERRADFGYVLTDRANQSTSLADAAYEAGERFIVAVGGDGTINEVASSLYSKPDAVMGICPFGTGNDFARVLNVSTEPNEAAAVLLGGQVRPVDIGLVGDKPFTNIAGLGFDVDVVINTEKFKRRFHGMVPYLLGIMKSLLSLKAIKIRLTADGRVIEREVTICAVGNGSHMGGGMHALPKADACDGLFDVCVIEKVSLFRLLTLLPKFIKGRHLGNRHVEYFRAGEVTIECERTPMQLDGELGEYAPAKLKLLPGALKMMLPKAGAGAKA